MKESPTIIVLMDILSMVAQNFTSTDVSVALKNNGLANQPQ